MTHTNGLSQDAQGRTQVLTGVVQNIVMKKSKCYGNRKLQFFKRKCRACGLNEEQITTLIHTRNNIVSEQLLNDETVNNQTKKRSVTTRLIK
jgi:hypothetical protein